MRPFMLAALVAVFLCPPAAAKEVAMAQILDTDAVIYRGWLDIPFNGPRLAPYEDMSDCQIYYRWNEEEGYAYVRRDGLTIKHAGILSCIGTEGAEHSTEIRFLPPGGGDDT